MKQRLLLALLMLFSSVGFMKVDAQISITLPKTEKPEDVTITFTSSEKKFKPKTSSDLGSYPMIGDDEPTVSKDGATATYKLKTKADDKTDLSLSNNIPSGNPTVWGNITLTLNGKVSKFKVSKEKTKNLQSSIISLSFTNNGELSELILGGATNAYTTEGLPNLKELSCAGNKLNWIPVKPTDMEASKYNIGTQILDVTLTGKTSNSKDGVEFSISDLKVFSSLKGYNITKAKDKVGNAVTVKKVADNKFVFTKGDIFFDGELTFDVEVTDTNYPGVIISGVKTTIFAPMFTLKEDNLKFDSKQGTITSNINFDDSKTVKKGDKIVLTPAPNDGYAFDKFTSYKGVSEPTLDGNAYTFIVLGDVDPVIEAAFKAKGATVTYNTPDAAQGTLRVTKAENNELVPSGNTVPVGTKLLITAKANDGYEVGNVSLKKADKTTDITPSEIINGTVTDTEKTCTYKVSIDGLDVQAAFTALTKALTTTTPNIKVTDTKGKEYTWQENKFDIPVGTELVFTLNPGASKVVSSVIINSESYEVTKLQDGTFTWKGFVMPEQDSKMVVTTSSLFDLKNSVQLVSTSLTYTGDPLAVDFTVNKNVDKTSFKVEYKVSGAADNTYTEKPFTNCGPTYKARITRPADGVYAAYVQEFEYTITKAQLIVEAPTVEYKDGKFVFAGGAAYFMNGDKKVDVDGKFVALNDEGRPLSEDEMADYKDKTEVKVNYSFDNANVKGVDNFMLSYGNAVELATIKSVGTNALTFSLKSTASTATSSALLADDAKVSVGSTIMFSWDEIEGLPSENYAVYQANANGEKLSDATDLKSTGYTIQETDKDQTLYFLLEVEDERGKLNLSAAAVSYIKKGFIYGDSWNLQLSADSDKELYFVDEENNKVSETKAYENISITYYKNGVEIAEVIDAGEYQVEISRPACDKYTEFKSEKISFTVSPAEIPVATVVVASSATAVGLGQPLSTSKITGVSDIAGKFVWNEDETVILTADGQHKVKFVPESSNYKAKELKVLTVTVSTQPLLTVDCDSEQGRVEIKDTENNYYYDGDLIVTDESKPATKAIKAKTLTITAVPADGFVFESFTFIKKGVKRTVKTNPCTQSVSDASLDVKANFKEKSAETVYHTISFSSLNVAGVVFNNVSTSNKVKEGDSFNFSMSAHPSDYSRIVVKDSKGKSYAVSSLGACTIDNVQDDLQLTVSLSNPTKYNVTLPAEYKDSEGNLMGTANFSGNTYYGGTITLTAVPKEGYKFVGWLNAGTTSTATTVQVTVTSNMTISARFESDGTIDPNTECIIRTPYDEDLTGVSINKQGVNVVKIGSDFEFTVAAYKDDLARVKVTVDGAELKATTGNKYVISKVKKNTEVKVTLDNPTRIKVVIEKETKNAKGYVMGHVDVDVVDFGTYYPDSTCYYNTKLRLAAYPESGVEFKNWSDVTSNTDLIREI